jgi:hypothetical protein
MKRNRFILLIVVCIFFASCRQDISGTYKAINPSDQFEKELIIIDWDGNRYFERAMIGHANELYTDESHRPNRHARIEYDYRAYVKGKLEKQGKKYIAKELKAGIDIDEEHLTINNAFLEPLPKITKEELIKYIKEAFDNSIKGKYDDATMEFVLEGNKLIPVGGNEVNDYFIKLVE